MTDIQRRISQELAGRYTVEREIGRGGMATVFLASDLRHERRVAIKVLAGELAASLGAERFLREIRIAARLSHPHVVPLYDSGEAAGFLYFVMPFVDGESLRARLDREKALPERDALRFAREAADALAYAHGLGVVHRDIKPENILLARGHALIADFGIARALSTVGDDQLTRTGLAIGTPTYMSPEQAVGGGDVDARSDIYSLGCVLHEMLAGRAPYAGSGGAALLARKLTEPIPSLADVRDAVSPELEQLVARTLARLPADRFQSAQAVVDAIDALAGTTSETAETGFASVAVLPFVNMSADAENEYFSDGISEELINVLAQVPGLRVAARTSSFAFKGQNVHVRTIAQQLGVGVVLEGSVRRAGDRVRVTAQLVNAADGYHMWSRSYDRRIEDVFAMQDEIAEAIASVLRVRLLGVSGAARRHSPDAEAYQYYLKGRHLWNQDNTNAARALEWYQKAIDRDPEYALACAGMADCYCTIGVFQMGPQRPVREAGIAAARKALELGDGLAEVRFSSGYVRFYMEWNWAEAEREFHRAIELNPNYEQPYLFLGVLCTVLGRTEEGEQWAARGRAADPVSGFAHYVASIPAFFAQDWERAIRGFEEALELSPGLANPLWNLSYSQSRLGLHDAAIANCEKLVAVSRRAPVFLVTLGQILLGAGREADARAIDEELERRSASEYVSPLSHSWLKADLGEIDEAFALLERAYDERNTLMWVLRPSFGNNQVRADPRFNRLLARMGLPPVA